MSRETRYDLGLIIPTREEFDYVRECIPLVPITGEDNRYWYEFPIPGDRTGVVHVLFDMGLTVAASGATRLLDRFDPEVLAVLGIGGALGGDLRLGDVVVGSAVQEYLKAARASPDAAGHTTFQPAGDAWPLAERLRSFTAHFPYVAEAQHDSWIRSARARGVNDGLPLSTTHGARRAPSYSLQPIASGDVLVTDPAFRDWLLSHDRKRGIVEMEAAGAARTVKEHDRGTDLLVLRGVSDFADARKDTLDATSAGRQGQIDTGGAWRRYATQNAAELLLTFLASPRFPWRRTPSRTAQQRILERISGGGERVPPRALQIWDYFARAAQVVEVTGAVITIGEAVRTHFSHPDVPASDHPGYDPDGHAYNDGYHL